MTITWYGGTDRNRGTFPLVAPTGETNFTIVSDQISGSGTAGTVTFTISVPEGSLLNGSGVTTATDTDGGTTASIAYVGGANGRIYYSGSGPTLYGVTISARITQGNTLIDSGTSPPFVFGPPQVEITGPDSIRLGESGSYTLTSPPSFAHTVVWDVKRNNRPDSETSEIGTVSGSGTSSTVTMNSNAVRIVSGQRITSSFYLEACVTYPDGKRYCGYKLIYPSVIPGASPPSATIQGVNSIEQGQSFDVSLNESGGRWDSIEYNYSVTPSNAGTFADNTLAKTTFTASPRDSNTTARISCAITVRGTGTNAYSGTYATRTVTSSEFTITTNQAVAPSIEVTGIKAVLKGQSLNLVATPTGGFYTRLIYEWGVTTTKAGFAPEDLGTFSPDTSRITSGNPATTTFTADQVPENIPSTITLTVTAERDNNGIITRATTTFTRDFTILSERRAATLDVVKIVGSPIAFLDVPQIYSIETSGDESYDMLEYDWSVEPDYVGSFGDTASAAIGKLNITTKQKFSPCIVCNVTAKGSGDVALADTEVTRKVTFIFKLRSSEELDKLEGGSWKEIPQPGIPYKLNPDTLPLIAEHSQVEPWKFSTEIEDPNEETKKRTFWEDRQAGNKDTVPDPSFIGRKIRDFNFAQNRLVFLTTDSVIASFAGLHGLFWGASAEGTIAADPIDLDIGNSVAAETLVSQDKNQWILTPEQQFALYPADNSGGWTPQSVRIDRASSIPITLGVRVWSDGFQICGGHPNGLILDLVISGQGVQPLDVSARCPNLLNWPKLTEEEVNQGKYQWDEKKSEVIQRVFVPTTKHQVCLQRSIPLDKDYDRSDPNRELLRTRLLITRQVRDTFCWSNCSFEEYDDEREEGDMYFFNYEIINITQHQEYLYMLVREQTDGGFSLHLESLYLGDKDNVEDCCDHLVDGKGTRFRACLQFSAPILYESAFGEAAPAKYTQFNIKSYTIHYKPKKDLVGKPFEFQVISRPNGREKVVETYNNRKLGYSDELFLTSPIPEFDSFTVLCDYDAKFFNVCIVSESEIPFEILGGEWNASISGPETRRPRKN